jgi:crotonobetainyl-CoA:carnitine CoA-transferase CaiB-like acyl-CoA transferase
MIKHMPSTPSHLPSPLPVKPKRQIKFLKGMRIVSLALNLPGPAALMRCQAMGANCIKIEPPKPVGATTGVSGDPMSSYNPKAYAQLHQGVRILTADLKSEPGQKLLHRELAKADLLLTSFRPSALRKLGLDWKQLHKIHPQLSQVAIVGALGEAAEEPGHDLTYLAQNDLLTGLDLPATLYADMAGSLMASEAMLLALMQRGAKGIFMEVALSNAAGYLALPRAWGLSAAGAAVGGGHAGYKLYACKDGRVALAALEPHFAARVCRVAGLDISQTNTMFEAATHQAITKWMLQKTCQTLNALALEYDIPLHTLPNP